MVTNLLGIKQDEEPSLLVKLAKMRYEMALWRYKMVMMRVRLGLPWREGEKNNGHQP